MHKSVGLLYDWSDPLEPPHLGTEYLKSVDRLRTQRDHLFTSIRAWLYELVEEERLDSFLPTGRATSSIALQKQAAWTKEAKRFLEDTADWYQAGLGRPDILADFDYWAKMAKYNSAEVALLSVGIEPKQYICERFNPEKIKRNESSPAYEFASRRFEMIRRRFAPYGWAGSVFPKELTEWVRSVQLDCHPGFLRMLEIVEKRENSPVEADTMSQDIPALASERAPEGREIASLAKLLTAIAIEEYGYDPASRRSPIPREIQDIADRLGLSVSQDTIRKYLQIGAKYLPKDGDKEE